MSPGDPGAGTSPPAGVRRGARPGSGPDLDLVLVLGYLGAAHPDLDSEVIRLAVSRLHAGARLALVEFDAAGRGRETPLLRVERAKDDRRALQAAMESRTMDDGWTDWAAALRSIVDVMAGDRATWSPPYRRRGRRVAVLLVSGGGPPAAGVDWDMEPEGHICRLLAGRGWRVFTVGTGAAGDAATTALLKYIADTCNGTWRITDTPEQLLGACAEAIADLCGRGPT